MTLDTTPQPYDVIIVGGGPAGLSAALVLGRCRRSVLVLDDGQPRNAAAEATHGFLTRDGTPPLEMLSLGRAELEPYGVEVRHDRAMGACTSPADPERGLTAGFEVTVSGGDVLRSRKLLLATGVTDDLPDVDGALSLYGRGVHHCPYCDGWEHRDGRLAVLGGHEGATALALSLLTWSDDVTVLLHGTECPTDIAEKLERNGVTLVPGRVARLEGEAAEESAEERLAAAVLEDGRRVPLDALFFSGGRRQHSELPELMGCEPDERGEVATDSLQQTDVPGLFLAGDADGDVQFLIVAAAEGAKAAVAINIELQKEELA